MLNDPRGALVPGTEWEPQASIIAPLIGGRRGHRRARPGPHGRAHLHGERVRLHAAVRQPRGDRHAERPAVRAAGAHLRAARGPARPAPPAPRTSAPSCSARSTRRAVFREITSMLKEIVDYDALDIRLVDEEARELVCIYSRDENDELIQAFRYSIDEGVGGWVARHNQAQLVNDMVHDPRIVQVPGTEEERAAGVDHRAARRARQGHRRALYRPHGRPHLRGVASSSRSCSSPTSRRSPSTTPAPTRRWSTRRSATASPASSTTATSTRR